METEQLAIMIPIFGIIFGVGTAIVAIVAMHRRRVVQVELRHRERMLALEKGLDVPPDVLLGDRESVLRRPRHLLRGLIFTFVGIALTLMLHDTSNDPENRIGYVFIAVGLAYLIYYGIEGRRESQAAGVLDAPASEPPR